MLRHASSITLAGVDNFAKACALHGVPLTQTSDPAGQLPACRRWTCFILAFFSVRDYLADHAVADEESNAVSGNASNWRAHR